MGGLFALLVVASLSVSQFGQAESAGLIVVGITGNETDFETQSVLAKQTRQLLTRRGIAADRITLLIGEGAARVTRERILEALRQAAGRVQADDEFWLVLYGHSGRSANGGPAFQVSGPRLTAEDLRDALAAIMAHKHIFIGTGNSGAFLPFLAGSNTTALAATAEAGEINQPRFPEQWVKAFAENPKAPLPAIGARAAQLVERQYASLGVLQGEHARLADPVSGEILEAPFGIDDIATAMATTAEGPPAPAIKPEDIEILAPPPGAGYQVLPPTSETRELLAAARRVPNAGNYSALMMLADTRYTVNSDRSTTETTLLRVFLAREEAVRDWADFTFASFAPMSVTKVLSARTILPDGTALVLDPEHAGPTAMEEGMGGQSGQTVLLPNAHAGCIVEISYQTDNRPSGAIPEFFEEIHIQHSIPVVQATITVKLPKDQTVRYRLKNAVREPVRSETEHSIALTWKLEGLPAFEPLPLDPPRRDLVVSLMLSSLKSWDDFTAWYRRIARDSDASDPTVRDKAGELAAGKPDATQKVKTAFEFVSSLRYVAIELGVNAFRPRTPAKVLANRYGDCKDKANLLVALLREMGIPARFVLVSRMSSADPDFPGWYFNHAIAYVPRSEALGLSEDLWLDTTDTVTPFGFVAPGNLGRNALVFEGETAGFKVVTSPKASLTEIAETWTLTQQSSNRWEGAADLRWTGLADYHKRLALTPLLPQQRSLALYELLDALGPGAEYTELRLSDLADLKSPVELTCRLQGPTPSPVSVGLDLMACLAAPERNRPLEINDGQPVRYRQTVRLHFQTAPASLRVATNIHHEAAGQTTDITCRQADPLTWERTAICEIGAPRVETARYAELRSLLREWSRSLQETWPLIMTVKQE